MLFFAQQATADKQGEVWANWVTQLARGPAPEDCGLPDARRPVRAADLRGDRGDLQGGRDQDGLPRDVHDRQPELDGIASAIKSRNPDVVVHGATFEDGVGMVRALRKAGFTPKMLYQTTAPSLGDQYSKAIGKPDDRGHLLRGEPLEGGDDARQRGVRREVPGDVRRDRGAGGRGRRVRDGAGAPGGREGGRHDRPQASAGARRLAARERGRHDPRAAELGRARAARRASSSSGQWQSGVPEIVLPEEAATSDKIIPEWRPDGGG